MALPCFAPLIKTASFSGISPSTVPTRTSTTDSGLLELLTMLKQEHHAEVITTTYTFGNDHAKYVYEKVGFRETDVVEENGIHEVNMAVEL